MNLIVTTIASVCLTMSKGLTSTATNWSEWYSGSWATTNWMQPLEYETISSNSSTYITKVCASLTNGGFNVASIQVYYNNGDISGNVGADSSCFEVNTTQNEHLVGAGGYVGTSLNSVQFSTSAGRHSDVWGVSSGNHRYTAYINDNTPISQIELGRSTQLYKDQVLSIRFGFEQHVITTSSAPTTSNPTTANPTTSNPTTSNPTANPIRSTTNYDASSTANYATSSSTNTKIAADSGSDIDTTYAEEIMYELQCNGIETNTSGVITAIPAGVCINADETSSYMLTCDDNTMKANIYFSKHCSGYARPASLNSLFAADFYDNINIICDMHPCPYINITVYNDTFDDISACQKYDRATAPFTQYIYVNNHCDSMWFASTTQQCNDESLTIISYFNNSQCSNNHDALTFTSDLNIGPDQCISDQNAFIFADIPQNKVAAVDISCGMADSFVSTAKPKLKWSNGLQCNGIETKNEIITAIPAGVCISKSMTASYKLKCTSNTLEYFSYSSSDCSGYSTLLPITTVFSSDKYDELNIVCDMNPCKYISITEYNTTFNNTDDCAHQIFDRETVGFTQNIFVENYCNSVVGYQSSKVYCDNQYTSMTEYVGDDKCIGSGHMYHVNFNVGQGQCVSNNTMNGDVIVVDVLCSVAESDANIKQASIWVIILVILVFFIVFVLIVVYIRCKQKLKRWTGIGLVNIAVEFNSLAHDDSTQT